VGNSGRKRGGAFKRGEKIVRILEKGRKRLFKRKSLEIEKAAKREACSTGVQKRKKCLALGKGEVRRNSKGSKMRGARLHLLVREGGKGFKRFWQQDLKKARPDKGGKRERKENYSERKNEGTFRCWGANPQISADRKKKMSNLKKKSTLQKGENRYKRAK